MLNKIFLFICLSLISSLTFAFSYPFNKIVFFGDSLSDSGNMYKLSNDALPKSPPYYKGEFSDGFVWAMDVADYFKNNFHVSIENYALGGETTIFHNPAEGFLPVTVGESISDFYINNLFADKSKTLFVIWIGGNDYLNGAKDVPGLTDAVVNEINKQILGLIQSGGKNFLVLGLPDLSFTPRSVEDRTTDSTHQLSIEHNQKLAWRIMQIAKDNPNITINFYDINALFSDLIEHPQKYNELYHTHISNVKDPCWQGGYTLHALNAAKANLPEYIIKSKELAEVYSIGLGASPGQIPCTNPDDYVFWDHVHPTGPVHSVLASILTEYIKQHYHVI